MVTKNNNEAIAITISGTMSVVYMNASNAVRVLRPTLRKPIAAAVPRTVARTAFRAAVQRERTRELRIVASLHVDASG